MESAIRIGLALHCEIAEWCRFARKNYFYPDMPKNFQTSQYDEPIAFNGYLDVDVEGQTYRVEIERAHMEEDTGKSTHVGGATGRIHGADYSLVDYNRAGIPLVEIVTKPIHVPGHLARRSWRSAYVAALRDLIKGLEVSEARMERGQMRCDVNLSLKPKGARSWAPGRRPRTSTRCGRWSAPRGAGSGGTRPCSPPAARSCRGPAHFHEEDGSTSSGRVKEEAEDYRYFPEPDLVPVAPAREWVDSLKAALPEPPAARHKRLVAEWGLSELDMQSIMNAGALDLIIETVEAGAPAEAARKWWLGELARTANEREVEPAELPSSPAQVARVVALVSAGELTDKLARQVIEGVLAGEGEAGRGGRRPRAQGGVRRRRADQGGGRRDRGQRRGGREDQVREPGRGRGADRRGDEGDPGAGGRGAGARTGAGPAELSWAELNRAELTEKQPIGVAGKTAEGVGRGGYVSERVSERVNE